MTRRGSPKPPTVDLSLFVRLELLDSHHLLVLFVLRPDLGLVNSAVGARREEALLPCGLSFQGSRHGEAHLDDVGLGYETTLGVLLGPIAAHRARRST